MSQIEFRNIVKEHGNHRILHGLNLDIKSGEFVVLVGPSGCGKSTTLRLLAGLEEISSGEISIAGKVVNDVPPRDRNIAMVFQNYALYPHMSVRENMAFSLKMRNIPQTEINAKVKEAAALLGLEEMLDRRPGQLSGGQRQRVAMGRAIVRNPLVFLFDEPLSNLDAKLRNQMRAEIKKLHERLKTTTVYVTHDQVEAMTLADRIVLLRKGVIEQEGSPAELYDKPANVFVGGFLGNPSMNFLHLKINDGKLYAGADLFSSVSECAPLKNYSGNEVIVGLRPEKLFHAQFKSPHSLTGKVDLVEVLGSSTLLHVVLPSGEKVIGMSKELHFTAGQTVSLSFDPRDLHFFNPENEKRIG